MQALFCRQTITVLFIPVVAIMISACGVIMQPAQMSEDAASIEQITRLERLFAEAALQGDHAAIEGLLAPEFVGVDPSGRNSPERRSLRSRNPRTAG